jgi:hypothetical protein
MVRVGLAHVSAFRCGQEFAYAIRLRRQRRRLSVK